MTPLDFLIVAVLMVFGLPLAFGTIVLANILWQSLQRWSEQRWS